MSNNNLEKEFAKRKNSDIISNKLAAINNEIRFFILEVLKEQEKKSSTVDSLYSREINNILFNKYGINITPQMLNQHLKQLVRAGLIKEVPTKKEVPNKIGKRNVKGYALKEDAFEDLFLEISFFADELLSFFALYESNQLSNSDGCCVFTVFNGHDKGNTFKIHKDKKALIVTRADDEFKDSIYLDLVLDKEDSMSDMPHLSIFFEDGSWCMIDNSNSDMTIMDNLTIEKGEVVKLKNQSFLKFYHCEATLIVYCSF